MPRVNLPPGCYGLKLPDGRQTPKVKPGTSVQVSDDMARAIKKSGNGQLGIVSASMTTGIGTKKGQRCTRCAFLAQAWSKECPRCGSKDMISE